MQQGAGKSILEPHLLSFAQKALWLLCCIYGRCVQRHHHACRRNGVHEYGQRQERGCNRDHTSSFHARSRIYLRGKKFIPCQCHHQNELHFFIHKQGSLFAAFEQWQHSDDKLYKDTVWPLFQIVETGSQG